MKTVMNKQYGIKETNPLRGLAATVEANLDGKSRRVLGRLRRSVASPKGKGLFFVAGPRASGKTVLVDAVLFVVNHEVLSGEVHLLDRLPRVVRIKDVGMWRGVRWNEDGWKMKLRAAFSRLLRDLLASGRLVIIEESEWGNVMGQPFDIVGMEGVRCGVIRIRQRLEDQIPW